MTLAALFWLIPVASPAQPACDASGQRFLDHVYFQICYDSTLKTPLWSGYRLLPEHLIERRAARTSSFRRDPSLASPAASNADFRLSGFSRGHMVPAADFAWSEQAFHATFQLTNVVPQRQSVNAGLWRKLENAVRRIAANSTSVRVFTGPLFDSTNPVERIGPGRVAVPTHTYKLVLAEKDGRWIMFAAIIPNRSNLAGRLNDYAVPVDEVERRSGLDFFSDLPDTVEDVLEAAIELFPGASSRAR